MAEKATVREELKGKKTHISALALVIYGVLDMLGIAPLDQTFTEGAGDTGALSAGVGAGLSALRAGVTKIQETLATLRAEIATLRTEMQSVRPSPTDEGTG